MTKSFGERLKELRKKRGLSQKELADILKIGRSAIGLYEINARKPDPETITLFADYFGISTDWLLGRDEFLKNSNVKSYETYEDEEAMSQEEHDKMVREMVEVAEKYRPKKSDS